MSTARFCGMGGYGLGEYGLGGRGYGPRGTAQTVMVRGYGPGVWSGVWTKGYGPRGRRYGRKAMHFPCGQNDRYLWTYYLPLRTVMTELLNFPSNAFKRSHHHTFYCACRDRRYMQGKISSLAFKPMEDIRKVRMEISVACIRICNAVNRFCLIFQVS